MSSPFQDPAAYDTFTLLDGSKRHTFPGVARVQATLSPDLDESSTPGGGDAVAQLNEATGAVTVNLTMWTHDQWTTYQSRLQLLRRGTKDGPAVFTCAHPEVRSRRMKRLYFAGESSEPYTPRDGYRATLQFREKLKASDKVQAVEGEDSYNFLNGDGAGGGAGGGNAPVSGEGQKLALVAQQNLFNAPKLTRDGRHNTSEPGYCDASTRVVWEEVYGPSNLFGGSAKDTEGRFRAANKSRPFGAVGERGLQAGDIVFYGGDPSGFGHDGVYDGKGNVIGNNLVTYRERGGLFDAAGRPTGYDKFGRKVDARGAVPLYKLGTPTSVGRPSFGPEVGRGLTGPGGKPYQGPPKPVTIPKPSDNPPGVPR
ncbi:hypothetical protein [Deinococcus pimensis]|uniref:hypothetical protein n=1 Tax=Deinococcus pimensis TaxID=309888 RepID=UPI00048627F6|nr:hypothetical protein [Deinococcus pimensis]